MTTQAGSNGGNAQGGADQEKVNRRNFLKVAGAVTVSGVVAATHLVAHRHDGPLPMDPADRAWARLSAWTVPLQIQNLVPQHAPGLAVSEVRVKALHNGEQVGFWIEWDDNEEDAMDAMARFRDAVAVQLPIDPTTTPSVTMGAVNQPVHIMQWRASWQLDVDEGRRGPKDAFPNMFHDAPPEALMGEEAARVFYPALYVGNPMARRDRTSPVEDLTAVGFGSLTTHETQTATGRGAFDGRGWRVVLQTPLSAGAEKTALTPGITTVIAFAVWNGSHGNRGSRKQWSNWTDLEIEA
jgi:hypothetical protein